VYGLTGNACWVASAKGAAGWSEAWDTLASEISNAENSEAARSNPAAGDLPPATDSSSWVAWRSAGKLW